MFEKCDGLSSHGEREHKYLCCCLLAGAASVTTRDEINDAVRKLALSREQFMEVPKVEAKSLFDRFLTQFTGGVDGRWWWEHFTHPTSEVRFDDGCGFKRISDVVPNPDENVWFVAEDDQLPFYPVFDGKPSAAQRVIGECCGFEYYLIAKDLTWLLCENHHDWLIAIGEQVRSRLPKE